MCMFLFLLFAFAMTNYLYWKISDSFLLLFIIVDDMDFTLNFLNRLKN